MPNLKPLSELYAQKFKPSEGWRTHLMTALLIFAGGVLLTYLITIDISRRNQARDATSLEGAGTYFSQAFSRRMDSYEEILRAGASLFHIAGDVSSSDWDEFIQGFDMPNRYPGTRVVGYAEHVTNNELPEHLAGLEARGVERYELTPEGSRPVYVPIIYANLNGPISETATFGYDVYSQAERRAAVDYAIDSADVAVTDPITLRGDLDERPRSPGLAMYFPIYSTSQTPTSEQDRRDTISGFTLITFNMEELITGLFGVEALANPTAGIQIRALVDGGDEPILYTSPSYSQVAASDGVVVKDIQTDVQNKKYETTIVLAAGTNPLASLLNPRLILFVGVLASLILATIIFVLLMNHSLRTAMKKEEDIQQAKEDLLALASHQLRTPASGVKQYLGILTQGYAGKLSKEQKDLLEKAFESNERQLEVINRLLFVAKADAKQIRLEPRRFNLTKTIRDSIKDHADAAAARDINLSFRKSSPIAVSADPQYIRLIVDNLISNAIKYSYPNGTVTISAGKETGEVWFSVKDQGVGIKPSNYERLFKKFSRLKNELSEEADGIGLGLYLSNELARAHGGEITIDQGDNGQGSVFTLTIPAAKSRSKRRRGK